MPQITLPQIRSTIYTMLAIFLIAPLFTAWQLHEMGEFHVTTRQGLIDFLEHAAASSGWLCLGWLFLASPFAGKITELLARAHYVAPDGTETNKSAKLTISGPSPDSTHPQPPSPIDETMVQAAKSIVNSPEVKPKPPQNKPPHSK